MKISFYIFLVLEDQFNILLVRKSQFYIFLSLKTVLYIFGLFLIDLVFKILFYTNLVIDSVSFTVKQYLYFSYNRFGIAYFFQIFSFIQIPAERAVDEIFADVCAALDKL